MTVAELIEKLKAMPQDAIVVSVYDVHEGDLEEVDSVYLMDQPANKLLYDKKYEGRQAVQL